MDNSYCRVLSDLINELHLVTLWEKINQEQLVHSQKFPVVIRLPHCSSDISSRE